MLCKETSLLFLKGKHDTGEKKKIGPLEEKQHWTGNDKFHFLPAVCFSSSIPASHTKAKSHAPFPILNINHSLTLIPSNCFLRKPSL